MTALKSNISNKTVENITPNQIFKNISAMRATKVDMSWGDYFQFLNQHKSKPMRGVHIITLGGPITDSRCVKLRKVLIVPPHPKEGVAGYVAFGFDENIRDNKLTLTKVTIACEHTGRLEHIRITPTIASSASTYKMLVKNIPRMAKQFADVIERIK